MFWLNILINQAENDDIGIDLAYASNIVSQLEQEDRGSGMSDNFEETSNSILDQKTHSSNTFGFIISCLGPIV